MSTKSTPGGGRKSPAPPSGAAKTAKVGELWLDVKVGATVVFPDGTEHVATGGFVFDRPGTFVVDGTEVTVK